MSDAQCRACRGEWPAATGFIAECGPANAYLHDPQYFAGWTLLGNQLPHIHWHLIPRAADDPIPRDPVWTHPHAPRSLSPGEQRRRIDTIRARLAR